MRFLFVDRILHSSPGKWIRGIKHITPEDSFLCLDEAGETCFIPSLIGESLGQLAAWNVMAFYDFSLRPVAGLVASARLHRNAYPGETLVLDSFIDNLDSTAVQYHSQAHVNGTLVFSVEGAVGPLLPMSEFIDEQTVKLQYAEINRPGTWTKSSTKISMSPVSLAPKLGFDRILKCEPGLSLVAEKRVTRASPYFADHFPRKPVLPMTLLLESKLNLAREFLKQSAFKPHYRAKELRKIKMNEFIYPGDSIISSLKVKQGDEEQLILNFRSEVEGKRVCMLELLMTTVES